MILLILIYLIGVFLSWSYTRKLYSQGGQYFGLKPNEWDYFYTFVPILNNIYSFKWIVKYLNIDDYRFFGIKKVYISNIDQVSVDTELEIKKYVSLGIDPNKIVFMYGVTGIWSITRNCLVGGKDQPPAIEIVQYGMTQRATYENNRFLSVKTYTEITNDMVNEINKSNGIVITKQPYDKDDQFRFDFIPSK